MKRTILAHRLHTDLRPGDRIVAIDGHPLPKPRVVAQPRIGTPGGPDAVALVPPTGSRVEHRLYPLNVARVTFERPRPEWLTAGTAAALVLWTLLLAIVTAILLAPAPAQAAEGTPGTPTIGTSAPEAYAQGRVLVFRPHHRARTYPVARVSIGRCKVTLTCRAFVYGARPGWVRVRDYLAAGGQRAHFAQTPCLGEDMRGCYWDAQAYGNHQGHSYWSINTAHRSVCLVFVQPWYDARHGYCTTRSTFA